MLDAHPALAIPPETGFSAAFLDQSLEAQTDRESLSVELAGMERFQEFGMDQDALAHALPEGRFKVADGLRSFYLGYAGRFGKTRWGDKSPSHVNVMQQLSALLPEARFLHVIRDGRDTLVSQRDARSGLLRNAERGARQHGMYWQRCIRNGRLQSQGLAHYLEVRYEQLVTDTETVLRTICAFLEIDFHPAMLQYHVRAETRLAELGPRLRSDGTLQSREERRAIFSLTMRPPDATRIGRWRERLPEPDAHEFELSAGKLLEQLGYPLAAPASEEPAPVTATRKRLLAQPSNPALHFAMGVRHEKARNFERALACYLAAHELSPETPRFQARYGQTLERLGRFGEAWDHLAVVARQSIAGARPWAGEALGGRHASMRRRYRQLGAELRQARFIACVAADAATCTVAVEPRLLELFTRSFPAARIVATGSTGFPQDFEMSYEDAAGLYGRTADSIRDAFVPLVADPALTRALETRYRAGAQPLVGISWHSTNQRKHLPALEQWRPLLSSERHRVVSLQYGDIEQDIAAFSAIAGKRVVVDPTVDQMADMDRFAAQVASLDFVVTISCTAAHLAGALGKPTFVLLHEDETQTWPFEGDSSPWYPTVKLMRKRPGEAWEDTIAAAVSAISSGWPGSSTQSMATAAFSRVAPSEPGRR
jgi:hypothetical protein